jgi:ribose transport system substrate-binding protein
MTALLGLSLVGAALSGEWKQASEYAKDAVKYNDLKAKLGPIPNPGKKFQLGFVCKAFENEFWRNNRDGANAGAKALQDAGFDIKMDAKAAQGEGDETGQLSIMMTMVNRNYDGLLVSPISEGNLQPGIERALLEKNIPIVYVNDAPSPLSSNIAGAYHWEAGELAAEWFSKKIGSGEVAIITGTPRAAAARERTEGFKQWLEKNNPAITVVDTQNGDWDRMKAKDATDVILKKFPNLKGVYANNDTMAMGCIEAVKSANKLNSCFVIGTDGTSEAHASIKAGELAGTVDNFPFYMSQIGMELLIRKIAGQDVPMMVYTPQLVVDAQNINTDGAELIGWTGIRFE